MDPLDRNIKSVLVVDDDPISLTVTANIFSSVGCIVRTAHDGIEALAMIKDDMPDLMAIDLIMPYLKGDRLCQIVREMAPPQRVRLAIISGLADEAGLDPAQFGADVCISKGSPNYGCVLLDLLRQEKGPCAPPHAERKRLQDKPTKRTTTRELFSVQHRLEFILQNMVEPLFEFTEDGHIVFANQSAVLLAGVAEHQLLGSDFTGLFSLSCAGKIRKALKENKVATVEIRRDDPAMLNGRMVAGRLVPFTVDGHHTVIAVLRDITDHMLAEKALDRSRAGFHDVVEKNADGILVLDAQDPVVLYANPMAARFLERTVQQLIGQPFPLPSTTDFSMEIEILRPATGERGTGEMRMVGTQWENRPARLITLSDITARKQLVHGLKTAKQAAEQANRAKSEFLANMSHELRSPLNALLLLAQDMVKNRGGNLTADQIDSLALIHSSGTILLRLIEDILDFSKIEVGRMNVHVAEVKVADVVLHTRSLYGHVAGNKGLVLKFTKDEGLPETIRTDCQKLEQILGNLISNAIKFSPQGRITVEFLRPSADAKLPPRMNPAETIAIAVTDTGIGIPVASRKRIFDAFVQADGSTSRRYGGTGLGLSISKKLAKLLGGDVFLTRTGENGSQFTLYIPEEIKVPTVHQDRRAPGKHRDGNNDQATECAGDKASKEPEQAHEMLVGRKVLLVDDEARNLFSIAKILEGHGLIVRKAIDGRKALALLEEDSNVDVVLMDIMMPGMDGYETIRRIRKCESFKKLPIIALTAKAMPGDRDKCLFAGADDYLSKPVTAGQLLDTIQRLVK